MTEIAISEFLSPLRSRLAELVATLLVADQDDGLGVTNSLVRKESGFWSRIPTAKGSEDSRVFSGQPCSFVTTMTSSILRSS
jgi:hypothetical protein